MVRFRDPPTEVDASHNQYVKDASCTAHGASHCANGGNCVPQYANGVRFVQGFLAVDHRVSACIRLWFSSGGVLDTRRRREPPFPGRHSTQSDGNAIGGYHRRLRSTAPPELFDFSKVRQQYTAIY